MGEEQQGEQTTDDGLYYPPGYQQRNAEPAQSKSEPVEDPTVQLKKGWEEDRLRLEKLEEEHRDLKLRLSSREGEEDLSGLTEDERVEKLLAKREAEKQQEAERAKTKEASEIKYLRITDKFFVDNEKEIMRLKKEEGLTLSQSVKIFKKQQELISKIKPVEQKKEINVIKKKDDNSSKSFGQMYREGI